MRFAILLDHLGNESLPLMDAAAALRAEGHVLDGFVQSAERRFWNAARALRPDAVLVPADVEARDWAKAAVAEAKRFLAVPAIVCGSEPTARPERIADLGADYAVLGEVDLPLLALAAALEGGGPAEGIPGVWTPKGGAPAAPGARIQDLDAAPFPYRGVYQKYPANLRLGAQRFGATRGAASDGDSRAKSPERVVEEFRLVAKRAPMGAVHFTDESFIEDRAWL
ncbi:MAG: cobalamin-dependent protein, partial [Candidatus Methylomirabilis sp.]|nr:cobalamin-dependent protein [Deltaproteobacteria bacterium]